MVSSEHLHLALNHFPIMGMPFAALATAWGLLARNRGTLRAGLVLTLVCASATFAVMSTGNAAADAYDGAEFIDSDGYALMIEHGERATKAAWAAYAAGAVAAVAWGASFFSEKLSRLAGVVCACAALVACGLSIWTADLGGQIRRPDFRDKHTVPVSTTTESP